MERRIDVITLAVGDLEGALAFYRDGLGLESPGLTGTEFAHGKAMRERLGDERGLASSLHNLGLLAMDQGEYALARQELEADLALAEKNGLERVSERPYPSARGSAGEKTSLTALSAAVPLPLPQATSSPPDVSLVTQGVSAKTFS